jgi:hypothetical protein
VLAIGYRFAIKNPSEYRFLPLIDFLNRRHVSLDAYLLPLSGGGEILIRSTNGSSYLEKGSHCPSLGMFTHGLLADGQVNRGGLFDGMK